MARLAADGFRHPRRPGLTLRLLRALTRYLTRRGQVDDALEHLDHAEQILPPAAAARLDWLRAHCYPAAAAVAHYRRALSRPGVPHEVAMDCHVDIVDDLVALERSDDATRHLDASGGIWSEVAAYNRLVVLLALGRLDDARRHLGTVLPVLMGGRNAGIFDGLYAMALTLHAAEGDARWQTLAPLAVPVNDPTTRRVLRPHVEALAPGERRAFLLRLLSAAA